LETAFSIYHETAVSRASGARKLNIGEKFFEEEEEEEEEEGRDQ
jgi:hypothetical protein